MALTREILKSHPISTLKKEISKTNIKGYSKMKKDEIVELMMKNKERFGHIKMAEKTKPVSKKDPKVQKIAKDFEKAISKGKDVAERVRKTKDVKPKTSQTKFKSKDINDGTKTTTKKRDGELGKGKPVVLKVDRDGNYVLVEPPVKKGARVFNRQEELIGTWDDVKGVVVPRKKIDDTKFKKTIEYIVKQSKQNGDIVFGVFPLINQLYRYRNLRGRGTEDFKRLVKRMDNLTPKQTEEYKMSILKILDVMTRKFPVDKNRIMKNLLTNPKKFLEEGIEDAGLQENGAIYGVGDAIAETDGDSLHKWEMTTKFEKPTPFSFLVHGLEKVYKKMLD